MCSLSATTRYCAAHILSRRPAFPTRPCGHSRKGTMWCTPRWKDVRLRRGASNCAFVKQPWRPILARGAHLASSPRRSLGSYPGEVGGR